MKQQGKLEEAKAAAWAKMQIGDKVIDMSPEIVAAMCTNAVGTGHSLHPTHGSFESKQYVMQTDRRKGSEKFQIVVLWPCQQSARLAA